MRARSICYFSLVFIMAGAMRAAADPSCEALLQAPQHQADAQVLSAHLFSTMLSPDKLKSYIQYLNGEKSLWGGMKLENRSSSTNREVARQSIAYTLRTMGYQPEFEVFAEGANVVIEIAGQALAHEVIEFGAHFDTVDRGADDNGAGVALLIHMAEIFTKMPPQRTVRMVFYDLEEKECEGSCHHVTQKVRDSRDFVGALVADSLGFFPSSIPDKTVAAEIGDKVYNLRLAREIFYQVRRLPINRGVHLSAEILRVDPEQADHGSYWKHDKPAILIARPYGQRFDSPHNHGRWDTTDNMNWDYYINAARLFAEIAAYAARVEINGAALADQASAFAALEDLSFTLAGSGQILPASVMPNEPLTDPHNEDETDQEPPDRDDGYMSRLREASAAAPNPRPPTAARIPKSTNLPPKKTQEKPQKKKRGFFLSLLLGQD